MSQFQELYQLKPPAATLQILVNRSPMVCSISEFIACNMSTSSDFIRLGICLDPDAPIPCASNPEMYVFYDVEILQKSTFTAMSSIKIPKGANVYVYSQNGDVNFTVYLTKLSS